MHTVWQNPRNVTRFKIMTLWHLEMSQIVTKCHTFSNLWYKATFTFYVWIRLGTTLSGYFSRTRFKCSFTVVKTPLYCTGKWSCKKTCTSAMSQLQLPCKGSTGQVPLPEHEISEGTPRTCERCSFRKFRVPGGEPNQLNRCKEAAAGSLLTCRSSCSFISQYNTMGVLPPWSCTWIAFWKNSHPYFNWCVTEE